MSGATPDRSRGRRAAITLYVDDFVVMVLEHPDKAWTLGAAVRLRNEIRRRLQMIGFGVHKEEAQHRNLAGRRQDVVPLARGEDVVVAPDAGHGASFRVSNLFNARAPLPQLTQSAKGLPA